MYHSMKFVILFHSDGFRLFNHVEQKPGLLAKAMFDNIARRCLEVLALFHT